MKLDKEQLKQLQDALLDAFDQKSLARMVKFELGKDADQIYGPENLTQQVFELLDWAGRNGQEEELLKGARRANPNNEKLKKAEKEWLGICEDVDFYTDEKTGLDMIRIPAGEFIYGMEEWLDYFYHLSEYWISKAPVTNVQYFRFVRETGHDLPSR